MNSLAVNKMKIFISLSQMREIGGITPSALNLLNEISVSHDITLCVLGYMSPQKTIPEKVKVIMGSSWWYDCKTPRSKLKYKKLFCRIRGTIRRILTRILGQEFMLSKVVHQIKVLDEYDIAIAYTNNIYKDGVLSYGGDYDVVLKSVKAKKKIAWVHNDPLKVGFSHDLCIKMFECFDSIVCVSKDNKRILDYICPEYASKTYFVYNMYNISQIRNMSKEEANPYLTSDKQYHFVTVARLDNHQKRMDRIVKVCDKLRNEGYYNFDWTVIGEGCDRQVLEDSVKKLNLKNLFFLGLKVNPFPYVLYADVSLLVSAYEGYSMTVKEAQVLGTPTIITRYDSAEESMTDGCEGIICDNSTNGVYQALKTVLEHPECLERYRYYLKEHPVTNELAIRQFNEVIAK